MTFRMVRASAFIVASTLLLPSAGVAQTAQPAKPVEVERTDRPGPGRRPMASLDVRVVISRYHGEKQISSLPYSLSVTANANYDAQLNMGTDVPVVSTTFTPASPDAKEGNKPLQSYSYRSVGTVISCRAAGGEDGRYEVTISVDDSSVFTNEQVQPQQNQLPGSIPVFRNFKTRNLLLLQDGQSRRFTAASDRVSGETVQVEVTLRVVK